MNIKTQLLIALILLACGVSAQEAGERRPQAADTVLIDGITIVSADYQLDSETGTATAKLTLRNEKNVPREFKLNAYGTQIVDSNQQPHYFQTITLGRVTVRFEDRQNYLHYLLQPDTPVELTVVAGNIPAGTKAIHLVKLVFEDSAEEGRFVEAFVSEIPTGK